MSEESGKWDICKSVWEDLQSHDPKMTAKKRKNDNYDLYLDDKLVCENVSKVLKGKRIVLE